jgi:hypothetical protein
MTISVWVLVISVVGKAYVGNIDNIATQKECEQLKQKIANTVDRPLTYQNSTCIEVKKVMK